MQIVINTPENKEFLVEVLKKLFERQHPFIDFLKKVRAIDSYQVRKCWEIEI